MKIISVHNHGNVDEEYVFLRATENCEVGHYLLSDSTYTDDGKVSNKLRNIFWFPDKAVKKGNYISVWTKTGDSTVGVTKTGEPVYRFFWSLKRAVWNDNGDCAVLLHAPDWQFFKTR